MAKSTGSFVFLFVFTLLLSCNLGGHLKFANGMDVAQKSWCIAKPSSSDVVLNDNIEYVCNALGDCNIIQPGGSCFEPNNLINHASAVMNLYYATNGRNTWNCFFSDSALIVTTDPSYDNCTYA